MRSNELKTIQAVPKIKRLKPIPSLSPREEWQRGEIVNAVKILLLIAYVNHDAMMIIEDGKEWTGEKALLIDTYLLIVKRLFGYVDEGYMMKKEFNQIKKDLKIRFDK
ncbi:MULTISPECIES: hypothetical protein [unclassified Sulfuricurvum]|uniref:hypothetical protein n=1 Tax=unclassified Sulfuricurvum TaxID=2632390 RepID=UPI00029996C7|nr:MULTISPECIES: hypothetical protein [unclassified Sulfuricurvum]AFV98255.1 hypothetical protein B649_09715 [Candidatus Sulfuricurvum sp. RIFRC-1]HBM34785.1 hypothetical protein [Sulfuricurvum sp.]